MNPETSDSVLDEVNAELRELSETARQDNQILTNETKESPNDA